MRKIETLFLRGHETGELDKKKWGLVVPILRTGMEWVLNDEGIPTEKIDGTACAIINGALFKRRHLKVDPEDKSALLSAGWVYIQSGIWWQPVEVTDKWHYQAWVNLTEPIMGGTYELVGPKIQGNPYHLDTHELWRHGARPTEIHFIGPVTPSLAFEACKIHLEKNVIEGIVWHAPDGAMAKIKRSDFGFPWPPSRVPGAKKMERGFWKDVEGNVP